MLSTSDHQPGRPQSVLGAPPALPRLRASALAKRFGKMDPLLSEDIADAVAYIVTRPHRVAVNEMFVRPTNQEM